MFSLKFGFNFIGAAAITLKKIMFLNNYGRIYILTPFRINLNAILQNLQEIFKYQINKRIILNSVYCITSWAKNKRSLINKK